DLAVQVFTEEGDAILLWALEEAINELGDASRWQDVMSPLRVAAKEYTRENSPVVRWIEDLDMVLDPEVVIETTKAHTMFTSFADKIRDKTAQRMSISNFRQALAAAFPQLRFDTNKKNVKVGKNRSIIIGLGEQAAAGMGDNVHQLFPNTGAA